AHTLSTLFPYTTLFRSRCDVVVEAGQRGGNRVPADARVAKGEPEMGIPGVAESLEIIRVQMLGRDAVSRHHPHVAILERKGGSRSEEHTSELQSPYDLV